MYLTLPVPVYVKPSPPLRLDEQTGYLTHTERHRIRSAAHRATRLYPGPVGELISRELLAWDDFGQALGRDGLVTRLVDEIMAAPKVS